MAFLARQFYHHFAGIFGLWRGDTACGDQLIIAGNDIVFEITENIHFN